MSNLSPVEEQLESNQAPLGSQFKSYELNKAINYYTLDPYQYAITKFDFNNAIPGTLPTSHSKIENKDCATYGQNDYKNDPGLIYKGVNFEKLLPAYTSTLKSVNDFPAQSYHRFMANQGYFNPNESTDNSDLWYYGAAANKNAYIGLTGAPLNVQEVNHIIFPEAQRGGLNTSNLAKYSSVNTYLPNNRESWESMNKHQINNNENCEFFNYNNNSFNVRPLNKIYSFDSDYCRYIGINAPTSGSMPLN